MYDFYIAKSWTFKTNKFSAHNLETPFGEDNDLISTFGNEEEESQLYISYSSDSHEMSDHCDANKS